MPWIDSSGDDLCQFCWTEAYGEFDVFHDSHSSAGLVEVSGIGHLVLDPGDFIASVLLREGDWEPHHNAVIAAHVRDGSIVLDVGAHIGVFSLKARHRAASVYAWEPNQELYQTLCRNISANKSDNIVPICCAVADRPGMTRFAWHFDGNRGMAGLEISDMLAVRDPMVMDLLSLEYNCTPTYRVPVRTLDEYAFERVDLVKLDVEGCEARVLRGAVHILENHHPVLLIECHSTDVLEELREFLAVDGYVLKQVGGADHLAVWMGWPPQQHTKIVDAAAVDLELVD